MLSTFPLDGPNLHSAIPSPRVSTFHPTNNVTGKVLDNVGQVADRVAVRNEVPASGAVAVVVKP